MRAEPTTRQDLYRPLRAAVLFTLALLLAAALAWSLRQLLLLLYASALFATLLHPTVARAAQWRIGRRRLGQGAAIALVLLAGLVVAVVLARLLLPPLWSESASLGAQWPQLLNRLMDQMQRNPLLRQLDLDKLAPVAQAGAFLLNLAGRLAQFLADFFTVLLLTVYLLAEGPATLRWLLGFWPAGPRERLAQTLDRGQRRMRGWLLGQSLIAALLTSLSLVVFGSLHLPYFYLMALITGLLSFVPILGPIIAGLLMGTVAGLQSWTRLALVLAFFGAYQLFDNAWLTPRVMRNAINVTGLAVIVALVIGGTLAGPLGALLAVPSAALAAELLDEYGHRHLETNV